MGIEDLLRWWRDWQRGLDDLIQRHPDRQQRAAGITALLRPLMSTVCACRLDGEASPCFVVESADAARRNQWTKGLSQAIDRLQPLTELSHLPPLHKGDRGVSLAVPILARGKAWGCLVVGLAEGQDEEVMALVKAFLETAARGLAFLLHAESDSQALEAVARRRREEEGLVMAGDAVTGVAHALNNSLNRILLQAALVQMHVPEDVREEVGVIRKEGAEAAALLRPLQQLRSEGMSVKGPVSLPGLVSAALRDVPDAVGRVETDFPEEPVELVAEQGALHRLLRLMIQTALNSTPEREKVRVAVARKDGQVRLSVEPAGALAALATEEDDPGGGVGVLEHLAMRSLLRRLRARASVATHRKRATRLVIEWPAG